VLQPIQKRDFTTANIVVTFYIGRRIAFVSTFFSAADANIRCRRHVSYHVVRIMPVALVSIGPSVSHASADVWSGAGSANSDHSAEGIGTPRIRRCSQ